MLRYRPWEYTQYPCGRCLAWRKSVSESQDGFLWKKSITQESQIVYKRVTDLGIVKNCDVGMPTKATRQFFTGIS